MNASNTDARKLNRASRHFSLRRPNYKELPIPQAGVLGFGALP
jgi:hypothetical protein